MRFTLSRLETALDAWLGSGDGDTIAKGQNFRWEERVGPERQAAYEKDLCATTANEWEDDHATYVTNRVNVKSKRDEPAPFSSANSNAAVTAPHERETLVRVEDLKGWAMDLFPHGDAYALKKAFDEQSPLFDLFFETLNDKLDFRPMFAAFAGDLDKLGNWRADWEHRLPEVLGLAHLTASPSDPRPVMLVEYSAGRVLGEPGVPTPPNRRFAAPTVLDHRLNPYFFPSPFPRPENPICYGRAVNLNRQGTLVCEIIHNRVRYERSEVKAVAVLTRPLACAAAPLRAAHLKRLRAEPGCAGFAED